MGEQRHRWTKEEQDRLIKVYKDGLSYKDLSRKLGQSIASIRSRLYEIRKQGLIKKRG